jgi:hypothetical protein
MAENKEQLPESTAEPHPSHNDAPAPGPDLSLSRRQMLAGAGGAGVLAAVPMALPHRRGRRSPASPDGTPEQIHLTWGADPATSVVVSWASPGLRQAW